MTTQTMTQQTGRYPTLIRAAAVYDILVTTILAVPLLATTVVGMIASLDSLLGFDSVFLPLDETSAFLLNLAGVYVTVWAVYRYLNPSVTVGRYDAIVRFSLVAIQVICVANGATPILLGIAAVLLVIGLAEWLMAPAES